MNKKVIAEISHGEYKNDLFKIKSLRHSRNRIQSKNHKTETYEIKQTNKNYHALKINYIFERMDMMDWLLVIRVNYIKQLS